MYVASTSRRVLSVAPNRAWMRGGIRNGMVHVQSNANRFMSSTNDRAGSSAPSDQPTSPNPTASTAAPKPDQPQDAPTTHFGFRTVPTNDKQTLVHQIFQSVASNYDIMNDVMSVGIHRLWKDHFVKQMGPWHGMQVLDVAGGTGDIGFRILSSVEEAEKRKRGIHVNPMQGVSDLINSVASVGRSITDIKNQTKTSSEQPVDIHQEFLGSTHVMILDINPAMLKVGQERAIQYGYPSTSPNISFVEGNAESLSNIPSNSMDLYTIAFGIRNVTHIDRAVAEAYRILKPGGRFMCLEFSHVTNPVISPLYDVYSFGVIPTMGSVVAGDKDAYQYLVESIRKFPKQEEFAEMIRNAGFTVIGKGYEDLTFGVAAIHSGFKV